MQDQHELHSAKKNNVSRPKAASPPTVATIQSGTLPISVMISITPICKYQDNLCIS
jgi:hypothetical protein